MVRDEVRDRFEHVKNRILKHYKQMKDAGFRRDYRERPHISMKACCLLCKYANESSLPSYYNRRCVNMNFKDEVATVSITDYCYYFEPAKKLEKLLEAEDG